MKDENKKGSEVKSTELPQEEATQNEAEIIEDEQPQSEDIPTEEPQVAPTYEELQMELHAYRQAGQQVAAAYEALHQKHTEQTEQISRLQSEYDNFRRRSKEESDGKFAEACADVLKAVLPVADNLLRAIAHVDEAERDGGLYQGISMTLAQFDAAFVALGVEEIECETFDPEYHHAVAHIEDNNYGAGQIVEVLQKGYKKDNRVIRYAMVKTAN